MATKNYSVQPKLKKDLKARGLNSLIRNSKNQLLQRPYKKNKTLKYSSDTTLKNWKGEIFNFIDKSEIQVEIKKNILSDLRNNFFKFIKSPHTDYNTYLNEKYKPSRKVLYSNICQDVMVNKTTKAITYETKGSGTNNLFCISVNKKIISNKVKFVRDVKKHDINCVFDIEIFLFGGKDNE